MFETKRQGAVDIVGGAERINADSVGVLERVFDEYLEEGQPQMVLDMQGVALIDGTGLELLLDVQERCQRRGGALKLAAPNPLCTEILKVTGVGPRFEIYDDASAAVRSYLI